MSFKNSLPTVMALLVVMLLAGGLVVIFYPKTLPPAVNNQLKTNIFRPASPSPALPVVSEVHSGDGTMTLIRKIESPADQSPTYSFTVANLAGVDKKEHLIFSQSVMPGADISIPANTWSPDNKYLFLQTKDVAGHLNYLAFKASGEPFAQDVPYLDVGAFFAQKLPKYSLLEATGWASPIFINVKTNEGPAYWFDVQARAFWGHR